MRSNTSSLQWLICIAVEIDVEGPPPPHNNQFAIGYCTPLVLGDNQGTEHWLSYLINIVVQSSISLQLQSLEERPLEQMPFNSTLRGQIYVTGAVVAYPGIRRGFSLFSLILRGSWTVGGQTTELVLLALTSGVIVHCCCPGGDLGTGYDHISPQFLGPSDMRP
jgi:hypothetical protein